MTKTLADAAGLADAPAVLLPRTRQIDLHFAGRLRRVFIALPPGPPPPGGHPVLWALDGNAAFPLLAGLLAQRGARPPDVRGVLPLVVALGSPGDEPFDATARAEDYTFAVSESQASDAAVAGGQADRLLDAWQAELQPWLARHLPVDPTRQTLFGHSFGGLLTLYTLFTRSGMFQRHLAASPSIWWGGRAILAHRDRYLAARPAAGRTPNVQALWVTAGSLEEGTPEVNAERLARQRERRQVGSARELVQSLSGLPGLDTRFQLFDGEDHGSLLWPSTRMAFDLAVQGLG